MPCRGVGDAESPGLSTVQSKRFLGQLVDFGHLLPHLVLTGGDPLRRKDIYGLIDYANSLGLEVSITPSATPALTNDAITGLQAQGIQSLGLSLDGCCAEKHNAIRALPGTFERAVEAARHCGRIGLPIQVNTLVGEETADDLPAIYELLRTGFPVMRWSLFMLISVGRGKALNEVSPDKGERIMRWVLDISQHSPFMVKTTEAPSYQRIANEKMRKSGMPTPQMKYSSVYKGFQIRDGHGIIFVSNLGEIYPSGFLPLRLWECSQGLTGRDLTQLRDIPRTALARSIPWEVRNLRIRPHLRWITGSRLRLIRADLFCPYEPVAQHQSA